MFIFLLLLQDGIFIYFQMYKYTPFKHREIG